MPQISAPNLDSLWTVKDRSAEVTRHCWDLLGADGWHGPTFGDPAGALMEMGEAGIKSVLKGLLFQGPIESACHAALLNHGAPHLALLKRELAAGRALTDLTSGDARALERLEQVVLELSGLNPCTPSLDTACHGS